MFSATTDEPQQQAKPVAAKKKNKCRGNRKVQRFRAKLRRQGMNTETITILIDTYNKDLTEQHNEREGPLRVDVSMQDFLELHPPEVPDASSAIQEKSTKRKRESRAAGVTTSTSAVSIAQPVVKRSRPIAASDIIQPVEDTAQSVKPDYLKTSDQVFKRMVAAALEGAEGILELLSKPETLQYARTYAQLVNDLFYLRLKQDYWNHYYKVAMTTGLWSTNSLQRIQLVTEANVQKRRQTIVEQLKQAEEDLKEHKQLGTDPTIDLHKLTTLIPAFVRKGQHKLVADFQHRKKLFELDANDCRLLQAFYDLQPSTEQITSAKIVWQATNDKQHMEEHLSILKQRIYTKRLPGSFQLLDHSIDNMEKLLTQPALHADRRATLSAQRLKLIARFKSDLISLEIATTEELIRSHTQVIAHERKKLIESAQGELPLPKPLVTILNAIAARQNNLTKRAQLITQQKVSFFDHAPAATNAKAGTVGAMS